MSSFAEVIFVFSGESSHGLRCLSDRIGLGHLLSFLFRESFHVLEVGVTDLDAFFIAETLIFLFLFLLF